MGENEKRILDSTGCEFGRTIHDKLNDVRVEYKSILSAQQEQVKFLTNEIRNIKISHTEIIHDIQQIRNRLTWLLGVYSGIGACLGAIFGVLFGGRFH